MRRSIKALTIIDTWAKLYPPNSARREKRQNRKATKRQLRQAHKTAVREALND